MSEPAFSPIVTNIMLVLIGVAELALLFGVLWGLKRWQRRTRKAEPLEQPVNRRHHEPVKDIDAEYGRDYRGPGRNGEPFFSPGALWVVVSVFSTIALYYLAGRWLRSLIGPIFDRWFAGG